MAQRDKEPGSKACLGDNLIVPKIKAEQQDREREVGTDVPRLKTRHVPAEKH